MTVEIRQPRTGKALKTKCCRGVAIEMQLSESDDRPLIQVFCKPPLDVKLAPGFKLHCRFVHQGKFSLCSAGTQHSSSVMVQCPELSAALEFVKMAARIQVGVAAETKQEAACQAPQKRGLASMSVGRVNEPRASPAPKVPPHKREEEASSGCSVQVKLSAAQRRTLDAVKDGKSVFFTGGAGSGKSFLLGQIRRVLPAATTAMTASTGAAACLIGGQTLHSFAGMGNGEGTLSSLISLASRPHNRLRWRTTKVLVIDEVSMLDAEFVDRLEAVARAVR